jgi:hypothetical protein
MSLIISGGVFMDEYKLFDLYCYIDDFMKRLAENDKWKPLFDEWNGRRGPQRNLSLSEVVTLNVLRFFMRTLDLKTFTEEINSKYKDCFPRMTNYENFVKASNKSIKFILLYLYYLMKLNQKESTGGLYFLDSTKLPVCNNGNIPSHRVTKKYASRGKTSQGWFYGFKLHGACNDDRKLVNLVFSTGSEHDSKEVATLTEGMEGLFVGDAGYLLKQEEFEQLFERHKHILAAARKNMKKVMTKEQAQLLRKRSKIETIWGKLKERFLLVYNLARSITGLFRHYCYSLLSYMIDERTDKLERLIPDSIKYLNS